MKIRPATLAGFLGFCAAVVAASAASPAPTAPAGDVPCKIDQRVRIQFPYRALNDGVVRGRAMLMLEVSRTGQLTDALAVGYTRREFAEAALEAVRQWRYTPSRIGGEAVGSTITLTIQFEVNGVLAYVKPVGVAGDEEPVLETFTYRAMNVSALDRIPTALTREGPMYPKEWIAQGRTGAVTVEFFIDEQGAVRFPVIVGPADDLLAAACTIAVRKWRFAPPLMKGRPVLVRAQQVFHFQPQPGASSPRPATR